MLNLSNLRNLLSQVLSPTLHAAVLFTPEGQLVSYAAGPYISKDEIRVVVGLGGELWQESREEGMGQLDSEVFCHSSLLIPADFMPLFFSFAYISSDIYL